MENKRVLIINDVTGYGKVSSFAMVPIVSAYGHHPYVLPTALVSNTMDYGSSIIFDTSQFIKESISKWKEYGFSFPVIATGLINTEDQIDTICSFVEYQKPEFLMVDPIMADDGKLYPGMNPDSVKYYKKLIALSDLIIPNYTEAIMLTGRYSGRDALTDNEYYELINSLKEIGAKNIVITGCIEHNQHFNLIYDSTIDRIERIGYDYIPVTLIGTGDVFSAALLSNIMNGHNLTDAVKSADNFVRKVVEENRNCDDHYDIYIEHTIQEVINEIRQR